ncbi:MAG: UDP-3-O-(3-hydroxymyristoyl)glucosamine N-acyltransferase [Bacteroidia bacterium]|nr:MAG: UDP-3-O-(3-hydroxymyristoyl)glucosamine N-acyltransferase [Bacteroidia bacterium]
MRFNQAQSIQTIAEIIGAKLVGNTAGVATGINEIHMVEKGDLVFVDHPKYYDKCIQSAASFIIINQETECPEHKALLIVDEPFEAYLKIVAHFQPYDPSLKNIADEATIADSAIIYPNVYIGKNVQIGEGTIIYPNVTIMDNIVIGNHVVIQSGTVIGSDAFYYNKKTNRNTHYKRMISCGRVIIEDDVELGANCSIDRGVTGDTIIGRGTKFDNLVHIGHDTQIGKNCLFAAQVGVAGGCVIEDEVILWGQVGVSKTLRIGKGTIINAQSGVPSSLPPGKVYFGSPVVEAKEKMKELVWIKRIPEIWEKLKQAES